MHITYLHNSWLKTSNSKSVLLDTQMSQICIQYKKCFELNKTAVKFWNVKLIICFTGSHHVTYAGLHRQSSRLCSERRDYSYPPPCPFQAGSSNSSLWHQRLKVYVECRLAWTRPRIWSPTTHKQPQHSLSKHENIVVPQILTIHQLTHITVNPTFPRWHHTHCEIIHT